MQYVDLLVAVINQAHLDADDEHLPLHVRYCAWEFLKHGVWDYAGLILGRDGVDTWWSTEPSMYRDKNKRHKGEG